MKLHRPDHALALALDEGSRPAGRRPRGGAPGKVPRTVSEIRRWRHSDAAIDDLAAADAVASLGPGQPLPARLRVELEAALGVDLGAVRLHTDGAAAEAADVLAARAFAVGVDVGFAAGAYDPESVDGRRLIAHEIAHTVQPASSAGLTVGAADSAEERDADAFAERFVARRPSATTEPAQRPPSAAPNAERQTVRRWDQPGGALGLNRGDRRPSEGATRHALEGLRTLRPPGPARHPDTAESVRDPAGGGRAIAVVPSRFAGRAPFDVVVHFHGNNVGYRETAQRHHTQPQGTVRDEVFDRVEAQVQRSGRNLIAILPQGSPAANGISQFGLSDLDAFVREVLGRLPGVDLGRLRRTIVSGHSGGGASAVAHARAGGDPGRLRPLLLFDAINNAGELQRVGHWLERSLDTDLGVLRRLPTPAARQQWLAGHGAQLVATYDHSGTYHRVHEDRRQPIMEGRGADAHQRRDANGEPRWQPVRGLLPRRDDWFTRHRAELLQLGGGAPTLGEALRAQYVIRTSRNHHDEMLRDNLGRALDDVDGERVPSSP